MRKHHLGFWMLTALVTGNMIGSGIFLLPANLAHLGSISLFSWIFTAAGALALAILFAKLSQQYPRTGGPYAYVREGLGAFLGFQTAYTYWIAVWVGNAAIAVAMVGYLCVFFPELKDPWARFITAAITIWFLTFVNRRGVKSAGLVQLLTTILKLIPILLVALFGWFYIHPHYYADFYNTTLPHRSDFSALSMGATLTFWAFIGLESATVPAASVINPKRNIPLATIVGLLLTAMVYIGSSAAIMGMIPATLLQQSTSPFADATALILGQWGKWFVAIGAIIACFGCLNGWILLQGQIPMAAADDKLFPPLFSERNQHDVPAKGLMLSSSLITLLLLMTTSENLVKQFEMIILLATLCNLIPYLYATFSAVLLIPVKRYLSFHALFQLTMVSLSLFYVLWAIIGSGEMILYYSFFILLVSVPFYAFWVKRKKQ